MHGRQLQWAIANYHKRRWREKRGALVGAMAKTFFEERMARISPWRRALLSVLEEVAGPALLRYVIVDDVRQGVLVLQVPNPALAYSLRIRWEQRLVQSLRAQLPVAGIHSVRFKPAPRP